MESSLTYNPKYFALSEFNCQETDENEMQDEFLMKLDKLREACGFPFVVTSGFRSTNHSNERHKEKAGTHAQGIAADIRATTAAQKYEIVKQALALGFSGIGVASSFIHVDDRTAYDSSITPVMWTY